MDAISRLLTEIFHTLFTLGLVFVAAIVVALFWHTVNRVRVVARCKRLKGER